MIHAFLEVLPWTALLLLLAHAWRSVSGLRTALGDLEPRFADYGIPLAWRLGLAVAIGALAVVPYAEELWRCWRARERAAAASAAAG